MRKQIHRPSARNLRFEVRGDRAAPPRGTWEAGLPEPMSLAPQQEIALVGEGRIVEDLEYAFVDPLVGPVQLRAVFHPYGDEVVVRSPWVDLVFSD